MLSRSPPSSPSRATHMAARQHRVLLYATCYNVLDGVTLTLRKLEEELLATGHSVCMLTTVSGDPANTHLVGDHPNRQVVFMDNAKPIPFVHDPNNPELSYQLGFSLSPTVQAQIDAFEPSIIHISCPDCTALHLIQYARTREIPLMGTYHSNIPEYMEHYPGLSWLKHILGGFFRHQYNFLQALYVPTPYIERHLSDLYKMERATKVGIWGRGVDVSKFHPSRRSLQYRRDLGIADDAIVVCWVGRLVPEKRIDIFCHVVRQMHAMNLNYHALVVGAGPSEEEIKSLPRTTFAGWMNADQLAVAYASSDVFLFPSSVETFGNVTLEAAASGLPVVVEAGCSGHLVQDNGYCCEAGDFEAFTEATIRLVTDKGERQACSEAGRRMALSMEKKAVVRQMIDNYSRVTDEFYTEYGGHHANRDKVYRKPDSFIAGNHPRPLVLVMVEYLFIVLFQVIWNMTQVFMYVQGSMLPGRTPLPSLVGPTTPVSPHRAVVKSSPRGPAMVELSRTPSDCTSPDSMTDVEVASDDGTASTDGTAETTASHVPDRAFGDCNMSHRVAKGFMSAMHFQCRMESHLRNSMSLRGSETRAPKRKVSADQDDGSDALRPELSRVRSDEPTPMESYSRMRRHHLLEV